MERQTLKQGRGRPTKYKDEYPDLLIAHFVEYLQNPTRQEVTAIHKKWDKSGALLEERTIVKQVSRGAPTLFNFALKNKISYSALYKWATERVGDEPADGSTDKRPYRYPDFVKAYKLSAKFQEEFFLQVGLGGNAPSSFAIFAAKNMIRWRDDVYQGFLGKDGEPTKAPPGYVLLPGRKNGADSESEFQDQENTPKETVV